jgi:hypothetical protein
MTTAVDITRARLQQVLHYDEQTGVFTWKIGNRKGKAAGCKRGDGYVLIRIDQRLYYAHQLAWLYVFGVFAPRIDHRDGCTSNNAFGNLREATQSQNLGNSTLYTPRTLPRGVTRDRSKYAAAIMVNYQRRHLGNFDTPEQASAAYQKAALEVWGDFAASQREVGR